MKTPTGEFPIRFYSSGGLAVGGGGKKEGRRREDSAVTNVLTSSPLIEKSL